MRIIPEPGGGAVAGAAARAEPAQRPAAVPAYLQTHYWWAYVHPAAVRVFERQWLVDLILWGNYRRLSEAALEALGETLPGRTLQVACVYGDLTARLAGRAAAGGGTLDVVDVLPVQLENLRRKLPPAAKARLIEADAARLPAADGAYERVLLFFLLHEQPAAVRERTLAEAFRVTRPGGSIVIVDYARPSRWNPLRWLWLPVLRVLEPFAGDLFSRDLADWLPEGGAARIAERRSYFGGLYQRLVIGR